MPPTSISTSWPEGDRMVGDEIAEDGIRYLQEINFKDRAAPATLAAE